MWVVQGIFASLASFKKNLRCYCSSSVQSWLNRFGSQLKTVLKRAMWATNLFKDLIVESIASEIAPRFQNLFMALRCDHEPMTVPIYQTTEFPNWFWAPILMTNRILMWPTPSVLMVRSWNENVFVTDCCSYAKPTNTRPQVALGPITSASTEKDVKHIHSIAHLLNLSNQARKKISTDL